MAECPSNGIFGLLIVAKDRILSSSAPAGVPGGKWQKIQRELRDPTGWDQATYDAIRQQSPASIFMLTEDVRQQVEYWKYRRNDCAHSKPNIIACSHVESFYYFILSNLSKISVNGSKASFIQMVKDHYNTHMTPSNSSVDEVAKGINTAINPPDLNEVYTEIFLYLDGTKTAFEKATNKVGSNKIAFCVSIYKVGDASAKTELNSILEKDLDLYMGVLRVNSTLTSNLNSKPKLIRQIWKQCAFKSGVNDFGVIVSLLNAKLIPVDEHEELFDLLLEQDYQCQPSDIELMALKSIGYYKRIEYLIDSNLFNDFDKSNNLRYQIVQYIENTNIDKKLAEAIFKGFNYDQHPFKLATALNQFFNNNSSKVAEYKSHGLCKPKALSSLK
ncbi:hypothetical protein NTH33_003678 [Vibrio mimicus]